MLAGIENMEMYLQYDIVWVTDYISQCQFVQPVNVFASSYWSHVSSILQTDNVLLNTSPVAASPFTGFPEFGSEFASVSN